MKSLILPGGTGQVWRNILLRMGTLLAGSQHPVGYLDETHRWWARSFPICRSGVVRHAHRDRHTRLHRR